MDQGDQGRGRYGRVRGPSHPSMAWRRNRPHRNIVGPMRFCSPRDPEFVEPHDRRRILVARHFGASSAALALHACQQSTTDVWPHLARFGANVSGFRRCVPWDRSAVFLGRWRHLLPAAVDRARIVGHRTRCRRVRFARAGVRRVVGQSVMLMVARGQVPNSLAKNKRMVSRAGSPRAPQLRDQHIEGAQPPRMYIAAQASRTWDHSSIELRC